MDCDEAQILIHGYMDGELDAVTNRSVEEHLDGCAGCAADIADFQEMRSGLRRDSLYHRAPAVLESRVRSSVRQAQRFEPRVATFNWRAFAYAAALCIVAILSIRGGTHFRRGPTADDVMARDVVASHVRSLMAAHLVDVVSSDKHTVKPWFDGKLDFAPPVERLAGTEYALVGGRLDYLEDRPVAAVVYRHRKHIINLFIWPSAHAPSEAVPTSVRGYEAVHWNAGGMEYWAVSDMTPADLIAFSALIRAPSE